MLNRLFHLSENKTDVKTEIIAGITTFLTMAYIVFVNPSILKAAGMPFEATMVMTCMAAAICTLIMGVLTNYPFAMAAGMGINAFVAFTIVGGMKVPWQTAMGMVVIEGIIIAILVMTKMREALMDSIPLNLKRAIGAGIGLFIALIGLKDGGIIVANPATFVTMGKVTDPTVVVALIGLLVTIVLLSRKVKGSILIGILAATIAGFFIHSGNSTVTHAPTQVFTTFSPDTFSTFFKADIRAAFSMAFASLIFALLVSDFFDTMGTVVSVGDQAGFVDKEGRLPRLRNVLLADSLGAILGGLFCCCSNTTYVESASGVAEGGRTGLTSVVIALLFALAAFFAPIVGVVPSAAVAPALIVVGFLMMSIVKDIDIEHVEEGFPAFITIIGMPFTYSIADGIGLGMISYVVICLARGSYKKVHPLTYFAALMFVVHYALKAV